MIVWVSIVDKHRPAGDMNVGAYAFEIDYPADSHFDFMTVACPPEAEADVRPLLNRLLKEKDIPDPVTGSGKPVPPRRRRQ
jgi:hypothetical protein